MSETRILIACEESQAVTIEFRKLGFTAFSCDTQDCSGGHPEWHIKGDVLSIIDDDWDFMAVFPPCTYLSNVGNGWLNEERYGEAAKIRKQKRIEAFIFFMMLWHSGIKHICIENPVGYVNSHFRKPDQIIHPYQFGDNEMKKTCLWLKGLPLLKITHPENPVPEPKGYYKKGKRKGKAIYWSDYHSKSKDRAELRSKTFPGIAKAMAQQWGAYLKGVTC